MKRRRYDGKSLFEVCHSFHCVAAPVGEGTLFMFVNPTSSCLGKFILHTSCLLRPPMRGFMLKERTGSIQVPVDLI